MKSVLIVENSINSLNISESNNKEDQFVLGGIFTQTEIDGVNKVPFLGDLPVLGYFFRSATKTRDRTELLIFITPRVVSDSLAEK